MRVLVTGGAGFIGTNLIKRLLSEGHSVVSFDNYNTGLKSNHIEGATYLNLDITNYPEKDKSYWVGYDVVFHMAAIARIQPSFENPKNYFNTNAMGTLNIVEMCSKSNIPLIYAGSSSKHSGKFKNPYTFSKDVGEDIIKLYQEHFNLDASITRFYNVYGPNQLTEGGYTTLIGRWLNNISNNTQCEIYGDGEQRRDFTHVDDIVDALIRIMDQRAYGTDFELGRGQNISVNEVAEMMNITPVYKAPKPGEARHTLNTDTTAHNVLGWDPKINLIDYLKK
jgi:UDP-glucose 4-epimerase